MLKENRSKVTCTRMMGLCYATIWNFIALLGNLVGIEKGWMRLLSKPCLGLLIFSPYHSSENTK